MAVLSLVPLVSEIAHDKGAVQYPVPRARNSRIGRQGPRHATGILGVKLGAALGSRADRVIDGPPAKLRNAAQEHTEQPLASEPAHDRGLTSGLPGTGRLKAVADAPRI